MICRLCLININVDTSVNIFNEIGNDGESKLVKIIAKYIHLEVTQQDEVSTAICQECHNHLTTFHKYCEFVEKQQSTLNNKFLVVEFDEQVITPNVVGAAELQESMDVQLKCEPEEELVAEAFAMRNDKDNASISSHSSEPSSTWDSQHDMRAKADLLSQAFNTQPPKTVFGRLQSIEESQKTTQAHLHSMKFSMEKMLQNQNIILAHLAGISGKPVAPLPPMFPINSDEELERVNNFAKENLPACVSMMQAILLPEGLKRNFHRLVGQQISINYNYNGVRNKKPLKDFKSLNSAIFEAIRSDGYTEIEFVDDMRQCFKLQKNRHYKKTHDIKKKESLNI